MKKTAKKLTTLKLDRETIRTLSDGEMGNVQGGQTPTLPCSYGPTFSCQ